MEPRNTYLSHVSSYVTRCTALRRLSTSPILSFHQPPRHVAVVSSLSLLPPVRHHPLSTLGLSRSGTLVQSVHSVSVSPVARYSRFSALGLYRPCVRARDQKRVHAIECACRRRLTNEWHSKESGSSLNVAARDAASRMRPSRHLASRTAPLETASRQCAAFAGLSRGDSTRSDSTRVVCHSKNTSTGGRSSRDLHTRQVYTVNGRSTVKYCA